MAQDFRNALQAMSNSAADTIGAPVDGIAWLLRKAGLNVPQNALGGSDWMRQQGLMAPAEQGPGQVLGETLGLLSPAVAAAKAPQIARGLLSLDDKAMDMGRKAAENQLVRMGGIQPATVWHGSPHKFDAFDSSKIGTGEGAQAYGHGLYLAESPDVARGYQRDLSTKVTVDGRPLLENNKLNKTGDWLLDVDLVAANGNLSAATRSKLDEIRDLRLTDPKHPAIKEVQGELARLRGLRGRVETTMDGSLYKVDLPDDVIARMIDWDKPLSQQAPVVRDELKRQIGPSWETFKNKTGGDYVQYGLGKEGHAGYLSENGIPGIRYLDGGSRSAGSGTSNFVVFPGEENALRILERNGQGLLGK